ncbi:aspartate aminotransferase family protein [Castellaniella sp.]|uniref:aspartate aminotransferase family protein n=1 Tax=Castellaniella sp. TaxID=1955812 RepID=UPI00356ACD4F
MSNLSTLASTDAQHQLHSYTNMVQLRKEGSMVIERGEGIYVFDQAGKRYIEGLSGLWSVAVGFSEPRLAEVAYRQMKELPFYHTFSHKTNIPSMELANKLVQLTRGKMAQAFFTNSGSEANDTIIKLVWYYNNALGRKNKKKIIARKLGYHGVTIAAGSLTGMERNHKDFDLPLPRILHTSTPYWYRNGKPGESEVDYATRCAQELEDLILSEGPDTVAAFIGEPIIGAGGVIVPPQTYWQKVQDVCRKYDVLVIADEVITAFGRTGHMFASDLYDIKPDFMTLSKQITSSYLPLSAVLMNQKVADVINRHSGEVGVFGHGYTASGHPVCTAVGLENIRIIEERNLVENARTTGKVLQEGLRALADHPLVGEVRGQGLIAAVEVVADKKTRAPFDPALKVGQRLQQHCQDNGLILRGIGENIAFCPPLITTPEQAGDIVSIFKQSLEALHKEL